MRISDWSSDVCSSDLSKPLILRPFETLVRPSLTQDTTSSRCLRIGGRSPFRFVRLIRYPTHIGCSCLLWMSVRVPHRRSWMKGGIRSKEHTSELQSLRRTSYAIFCLKKKSSTE